MELREFLERVLPDKGSSYFGAATNGGKFQQTKLKDLDALENYIKANVRGKDVYFATGTYTDKREGKSTELKKALYVDLDCGPEPSKYATKKDALVALTMFCKSYFYPPSIIVDSGGGIHAYWTFKDPIPPAKWVPLADGLKNLCEAGGLKTDPTVTADIARVLRAPCTVNYKNSVPRPTRIFHDSPKDYTVKKIEEKLGVQAHRPQLSLAVDNDDLSGDLYSGRKYYAKHIIKNCPMFTDAYATQGAGLPESLWTQQLHILAYTEDGEDYVHEISKGYNGYAQTETQMKWNQRIASRGRVGPTLCNTFAQWSSHCATCPHRGHISTPLQLGTDRDPTLPFPYDQDENGVFISVQRQDDRGVVVHDRLDVTQFPIKDFSVVYGEGMTYLQFVANVAGIPYNVEVNYADITEKRSCLTALSNHHVILSENEYKNFRDLMSAWTKRMQESKATQRMWTQLGWVDSPPGFALANEVLLKNGNKLNNIHHDRYLASLYQPVGERDPWIKLAHKLTEQNRHAISAIICTAFAAPLMEFMRDSSAALAFVSSKSGSGKTTAMQLAQAVWGNPRTAVNQLDDTQASIFRKLGYLNNLPAYWDEVRAKDDVYRFVKMIFQMTGGKERSRLNQHVEMREQNSWNTILTVASNESIADHTDRASQDSEAGRARVFEVIVPAISAEEADHNTINDLMLEVYNNYGVVGQEYADFLVKHTDIVKQAVAASYQKLSALLLQDSSERFWLTSVTALYVAARLTNKLGFTKIDLNAFDNWLVTQFDNQRLERIREYGENDDHPFQIVMDFLSQHRSETLISERLITGSNKSMGRIYRDVPVGEIVAAIGLKDKMLRLNRRRFTEWLYSTGVGTPKMVMGALNFVEHKAVMEFTAEQPIAARIRVYDMALPDEHMEQALTGGSQ